VIGDSGAVRVYVDGAKVLDLAGVDTRSSQRAGRIIQLGYSNSSVTYLFDDLYVIDSPRAWASARSPCSPPPPTWPRPSPLDRHRQLRLPRRGRARHHRLCDRLGPGATDTYDLADLATPPAVIDAIQLTALACKTDAATRALALQAVSGGTTDDGPNFYLTASFTPIARILPTDPATAPPGRPRRSTPCAPGPRSRSDGRRICGGELCRRGAVGHPGQRQRGSFTAAALNTGAPRRRWPASPPARSPAAAP
jgi:hypothetical protein